MKRKPKKIIGRREIVEFPELNLMGIEAKVDTGAFTSALHCRDLKPFEKRGKQYISFTALDPSHPEYEEKEITMPVKTKKLIKNSFGQREERYVISTKIVLFEETFDIDLSLADRSQMEYPVLLGRKILQKGFIVDVSKLNCSIKQKLKSVK